MSKGPDAFRTISEVAEELDLPQHVLRFWETRFQQIRPMKRGGGRRYYRPEDVELLRGIRRLLYGEGYTIKGVQRILKEQGLRHVASFGRDGPLDPAPADEPSDPDFAFEGDEEDEALPPVAEPPPLRGARREPVFEARREPRVEMPVERPPSPGRRSAPEPSVPNVSNFPAAPPDEPDSFETYLPPPHAPVTPQPVERAAPPVARAEPRQPPALEERRNPRFGMLADEPEPHQPAMPSRAMPSTAAAGPSREDVQTLEAVLIELLECKRLLDQSR